MWNAIDHDQEEAHHLLEMLETLPEAQAIAHLEDLFSAMEWESVPIEPFPQPELEQELPEEWQQELAEYSQLSDHIPDEATLEQLESDFLEMEWETIDLEPFPGPTLEQELPVEWQQELVLEEEREMDEYELYCCLQIEVETFTQERLEVLLEAPIEMYIPGGDIEANARDAVSELAIDIGGIYEEADHGHMPLPDLKFPGQDRDDFGR